MSERKVHEPLAAHTHFKLGGPADVYVEAKTTEDLIALVREARSNNTPFVALGGGTNTLVRDEGFRGMVIHAANRNIIFDAKGHRVTAEAGVLSSSLARKTAEAGLSGLEWMISLPGTVGGAVRGNAGCFGEEVKDALVFATIYDVETDAVRDVSAADLAFGYRESAAKHKPWVVLSATFVLTPRVKEENLVRLDEVLAARLASQPKNERCAGCAFKNFAFKAEADIEKLKERIANIPAAFLQAKKIPAGWIIDQLALKGTTVGGARVSSVHGNFIVNDGEATADHILQLLALLKTRVRNETGVQLEEEIQII